MSFSASNLKQILPIVPLSIAVFLSFVHSHPISSNPSSSNRRFSIQIRKINRIAPAAHLHFQRGKCYSYRRHRIHCVGQFRITNHPHFLGSMSSATKAVNAPCQIRSRLTHTSIREGINPHEAVFNRKPLLDRFRIFGSISLHGILAL